MRISLSETNILKSEFEKTQRKISKDRGFKKLKVRPVEVQLRTGTKVKYDSLKQTEQKYN